MFLNLFKKKNNVATESQEKKVEKKEQSPENVCVVKTKCASVKIDYTSKATFLTFFDHIANDQTLHNLCFEDAYLLMKQLEHCTSYSLIQSPYSNGPFFDTVLHYNKCQNSRTRIRCINYTDKSQLLILQLELWKENRWISHKTRIKFFDDDIITLRTFLQTSLASCTLNMFKHLINI